MELTGKVAWVAGGSSGIGAAVARELASRGALVAISARRVDELAEMSAGTMLAVPADLAVLSAAYWTQMSARDWDTEIFNRHVQVNLIGMSNGVWSALWSRQHPPQTTQAKGQTTKGQT